MDKIAILHQLDKRPTNSLSDRPPTQKGLKKKKKNIWGWCPLQLTLTHMILIAASTP